MRGLSLESVAMSIVEQNLLLLPAAVTNIDYLSPSGRGEALSDSTRANAGRFDSLWASLTLLLQ
jgi:hypothetical protein